MSPKFSFYADYLLLEPAREAEAGYLPSGFLSSPLRRNGDGILKPARPVATIGQIGSDRLYPGERLTELGQGFSHTALPRRRKHATAGKAADVAVAQTGCNLAAGGCTQMTSQIGGYGPAQTVTSAPFAPSRRVLGTDGRTRRGERGSAQRSRR